MRAWERGRRELAESSAAESITLCQSGRLQKPSLQIPHPPFSSLSTWAYQSLAALDENRMQSCEQTPRHTSGCLLSNSHASDVQFRPPPPSSSAYKSLLNEGDGKESTLSSIFLLWLAKTFSLHCRSNWSMKDEGLCPEYIKNHLKNVVDNSTLLIRWISPQ
ncbi:unnamed protein product [Eretmochelys imbricata]